MNKYTENTHKSPPLESTYLYEYYREISEGNIVAGQEMVSGLERLIRDYYNPKYYYDPADAEERIDFMENCIKLTKSPFYGKPMILMLWQKAYIESLYSFKMSENGTDRFRRTLLLIGRKNTKSETCSALTLTELILGKPGSDLVCSSNDDMQANILYEAINTMRLMIDPEQLDTWKNQQHIKCTLNDSKVFKLSDRTRNKEGRNIDFAVVDEVHEMKDNVIIKSIEQSQSLKENPKLIIITTEGFVNDGFLDAELIKARSILNGEDDSISADRYLPWLYTQDSESEVWSNPETWYKSNPTLGIVKRWDYMKEQVDAAKKSNADRAFTLSKDFNFKVSSSEAWLLSEMLENTGKFDINSFYGNIILGGVDLAETTDMCSAKALIMRADEDIKYIHSMYWIPSGKLEHSPDTEAGAHYFEWQKQGYLRITEGNEVDVSLIADWYVELYKKYKLRPFIIGYDQRFSKEFLKRMDSHGIECERINQNRETLTAPMRLIEADFISGLINYNENPIDKWCLQNTCVKVWDTGHIMPVKPRGMPGKRIDGAASLINAYEIYRRYKSEFTNNLR